MPVHPQVQTMLDAMGQMAAPATSELSLAEARSMYLLMCSMEQAEEIERVDDRLVPGEHGDIPVRVYTPAAAVGANHGVLLWFHGGGWVLGDLESGDSTCRALANRAGCVVVSVDYRCAPEEKAPAAIDDSLTALTWTVENAELLGVDATRVAVGGESAGGNLAALLCQRVRDEFGPDIDFQLLIYPVTDLTMSHPSVEENGEGYFFTKDTLQWFIGQYLDPEDDPKDPALSPLHAASLANLPPALVITAEFDPLRDEGEAYAVRMQEAGVTTQLVRYDGQIHGFVGMATTLDDGRHALELAGAALRAVLT
ncbi:MAG: alpha/beta hydrolase [Acidimicrobiales bacterium]